MTEASDNSQPPDSDDRLIEQWREYHNLLRPRADRSPRTPPLPVEPLRYSIAE